MATATTPFPIHGKIGSLLFSVRHGKQYVRQAPTEYKFRQGTPAHGLNRREFAGAAMLAGHIYRHIKGGEAGKRLGPIFCAYPQNRITAQLKQGAERERKLLGKRFVYADVFRFRDTARALQGLDLSHENAATGPVKMLPIGPLHNPTQIQITGLGLAAEAIARHGNARLELRIHLRHVPLHEVQYLPELERWKAVEEPANGLVHAMRTDPSGWIPAEIIPAEGIKIPLPPSPAEAKFATCLIVEWRQVFTVGGKTRHLPKHAIVRIASLHAPANAWQKPQASPMRAESHHITAWPVGQAPQKPSKIPAWQSDPRAYMEAALSLMRLKSPPQ